MIKIGNKDYNSLKDLYTDLQAAPAALYRNSTVKITVGGTKKKRDDLIRAAIKLAFQDAADATTKTQQLQDILNTLNGKKIVNRNGEEVEPTKRLKFHQKVGRIFYNRQKKVDDAKNKLGQLTSPNKPSTLSSRKSSSISSSTPNRHKSFNISNDYGDFKPSSPNKPSTLSSRKSSSISSSVDLDFVVSQEKMNVDAIFDDEKKLQIQLDYKETLALLRERNLIRKDVVYFKELSFSDYHDLKVANMYFEEFTKLLNIINPPTKDSNKLKKSLENHKANFNKFALYNKFDLKKIR